MQRILITVSILTLVCLFAVFFFWRRNVSDVFAAPKIVSVSTPKIVPMKQRLSRMRMSKTERPQPVDPDAFYQTIIDNNIFRPLNWKPPQREPVYILLGTAIATDGNTAAAYIQERKSDQFHVVTVGDSLGESTVQKITPKRVTLTTKKGDTLNLSLGGSPFLNPRRTQSMHSYERVPQVENTTENKTMQTAKSKKGTGTETDQQRSYKEGLELLKKRANELRAERTRMQERLRYLEQR
ncbi:hypothetical protein C6501_08395 [Candidatus Poribacteria bacterium]|nr:MAG: hypothetical protein C6501_08395 [Candidatus Poribacteria bacterium]